MKYRIPFLIVFVLFFGCTEDNSLTKPLLDFVPKNASVVIKINDLAAFKNEITTNDFISDLSKIDNFKKAIKKVQFLNFLNPKSKSILAFTKEEEGFESIFLTDNYSDLVVIDSIENSTIEEFDFKGISLQKYQVKRDTFYQANLGTKFVMTSSPLVIEALIENLKKNTASESLNKLYKISNGYKSASLYLNIKKSTPLLRHLLKSESQIDISSFSDWMSLDFNSKPSQLNLTGISIANDSVWNYIDLFANTKPLTNVTPSLAPLEIDALVSYTFDNYKTFASNQSAFLTEELSSNPLFETVEEVGIIHKGNQKAIILNTHGSEMLASYLEQEKKATLDYQGNQIIGIRNSTFISDGFRPLVQNFKSNYFTFINDAFVFSETKEVLENIIQNHKNGTTFNKGATFQSAKNSLAEESNLLFISNSTSLKDILKQDFLKDFNKELNTSLQSEFSIAAQITTDKNFYHTNIIIEKNTKTIGNNGISELFKVKLDTASATRPQFVTNHLTKQKEVIVQDHKNVLHLISSKGKILWKKPLEGQVQGEIKQVDIFKNGRLQLAFTTNNQFMVLDRNGKEVKRFSKTFEGGGLNPIAVFDYDGKKNYRFVITQGKKTFMYNSKAAIVDGFKYTVAEDIILDAPKHIRISKKDFLIFKLKGGSLKILNRLGEVRTKVVEKIDFSENDVFLNKDKFTLTDKKGTLYQIEQSGKVAKTNFNLSRDHGMFATANTLVLMNDNILTIRGKKVELELGVYTSPKIFYINNKIYVTVTDLQSQKVYLFDSQAKPIPNFPIYGNSMADLTTIAKDKTLEVVVLGKSDEIISYKLN